MEKLISHLLALLALTSVTSAETLLLRGATVHTVAKGILMPADVLIKDGRIAAVIPQVAGAGMVREGKVVVRDDRIVGRAPDEVDRTVDLTGMHLFPGLISPSTDLGLVEISGVRASV